MKDDRIPPNPHPVKPPPNLPPPKVNPNSPPTESTIKPPNMPEPQGNHDFRESLFSDKYDPRTQVRIYVGVQRGEYFMQASCVLAVAGRSMMRVMSIPPQCKDDARNMQICEDLIKYNLAQDMIYELQKYVKRGGKPEEESA